jgi:GNAT superfamily N-acetyltransferase
MDIDDFEDVVTLLTYAFMDTPFHRYIAPDDAERRDFLDISFRSRISQGLGHNDINLAVNPAGRIIGVASWIRAEPQVEKKNDPDSELSRFSDGLRERYTRFLPLMFSETKRLVTIPVWHLAPIAVLPSARGQGVASTLIRMKLDFFEKIGAGCALSTQSISNEGFYAHFGFVTLGKTPIAERENIWNLTMIWKSSTGEACLTTS